MLYVFLVDNGTMKTLEMNLALESVAVLKKVIAEKFKVPQDKQVLLISGGENLNPTARICSYSAAGTDTSPIFLFNKTTIESSNPPQPTVDYGPDIDMKDRIEGCLDMQPAYNTVVSRAELSKQLHEMAAQQLLVCERLVHDQHLQHQGWAAVVANLEDITNAFINSSSILENSLTDFIAKRSKYVDMLTNFEGDLNLLEKIPVLPSLKLNCDSESQLSLRQWISNKDNQNSLEHVAEMCSQTLTLFNESLLEDIKKEVKAVVEDANNSSMKEIKGLEERLYGLEKLMCQAKKIVCDQAEYSQAFYQNQLRASNLRDPSIFVDLCKGHQHQLQIMLQNHQQLRDIRRKCVQAKKELSGNLHARLRWIMFVEKKLSEVDAKIMFYRENLRRLTKHLEVIQQVNLAPKVYLSSIAEVVRRRIFSDKYLSWASVLASQSLIVYENEVELRKNYMKKYHHHFLQTLFPGLNDMPPAYATSEPTPFDQNLPAIKSNDIEQLKNLLPELSDFLDVPSQLPLTLPLIEKLDLNDATIIKKESDVEEFETVSVDIPSENGKKCNSSVANKHSIQQGNNEETDRNKGQTDSDCKDCSTSTTSEIINVQYVEVSTEPKIVNCSNVSTSTDESVFQTQMDTDLIISNEKIENLEIFQKPELGFVDVSTSTSEFNSTDPTALKDEIDELQKQLEAKQNEYTSLCEEFNRKKEMANSMSQGNYFKSFQEKVAVLSSEIGDVVLLFYDDKHDSYIVFTLSPTLHFLHSDSLDMLNLRTGLGEPRKSWALVEIISKEFCQAKKAENRYKVPVGTRFYRVKAKPWHKATLQMKKMRETLTEPSSSGTCSMSNVDKSETTLPLTSSVVQACQSITAADKEGGFTKSCLN